MGQAGAAPTQTYSEFLYETRLNHPRLLVCAFSHPSAHGSLRWGDSLAASYLVDVVVPTLNEAMQRLGRG